MLVLAFFITAAIILGLIGIGLKFAALIWFAPTSEMAILLTRVGDFFFSMSTILGLFNQLIALFYGWDSI